VSMTARQILVVEDDVDAREALAAFLENEGYTVLEANHGEEALAHLRASPVCIVLLDLMMPVMNGWDFRAEQMKDPQMAKVPVVVVTADSGARRRARSLGVVDYMVKPIDFERLLQLVEEHC
jgi:CheY-like chemotaxis protein